MAETKKRVVPVVHVKCDGVTYKGTHAAWLRFNKRMISLGVQMSEYDAAARRSLLVGYLREIAPLTEIDVTSWGREDAIHAVVGEPS